MAPTVLAAAGAALFALAVAGGAALRVRDLDRRPMHTDEAVQAVKTGELLESGRYEYDPREYHGPSLYYLAQPLARAAGGRTLADLRADTLRLLPALFGLGLVLLTPLFAAGLGRGGAGVAAAGLAVSPFLVYFSRYYVQEMLLVFFTALLAAAVWRYARQPRGGWAALAGFAAGLMFATKETAVIAWLGVAAGLPFLWSGSPAARQAGGRLGIPWKHLALAAGVALAAAALFFTSFLTHPRGLADAVSAYGFFAHRAGGQGHEKPWFYYLQILFAHRAGPLGWWSEAWLLPPALAALLPGAFASGEASEPRKRLARFLAAFTLVTFALYSVIPYKTPWLILTPLWSLTLLAAAGLAALFGRWESPAWRGALAVYAAAALADLERQSHWINGRFAADPRNPCAYEHTSPDVDNAARLVADVAAAAGTRDLPIHVVSPEYWPLPWYLRAYPRVGYWAGVPESPDAAIVVTFPALRPELDARLKDRYVESLFGLRPNVVLQVLVRSDLWDGMLALRAKRAAAGKGTDP